MMVVYAMMSALRAVQFARRMWCANLFVAHLLAHNQGKSCSGFSNNVVTFVKEVMSMFWALC